VRLNDPEVVRREYADESAFLTRRAIWDHADGPDPRELAYAAVAEVAPRNVLEVGCGPGDFAQRLTVELGCDVAAIDLSARMVELTRARGVDARVGDVQELPFADGKFDCAVANWMLYHVPDLDRALTELARVLRRGGRLVAATNSERNLEGLWALFGADAERDHSFTRENGKRALRRVFAHVGRRDADGSFTFQDHEAARTYVAASATRAHLAERLPALDVPFVVRRAASVFVADKAL
jgi:SAM-dependent methyltransferase